MLQFTTAVLCKIYPPESTLPILLCSFYPFSHKSNEINSYVVVQGGIKYPMYEFR